MGTADLDNYEALMSLICINYKLIPWLVEMGDLEGTTTYYIFNNTYAFINFNPL